MHMWNRGTTANPPYVNAGLPVGHPIAPQIFQEGGVLREQHLVAPSFSGADLVNPIRLLSSREYLSE